MINFNFFKKIPSLFKAEYRSYGWHIVLLGFLSFFGGILESFGITAIIPVFSLISKGNGETTDLISQLIGKVFGFFHLPYTVKFLLAFVICLFILKALFSFIVTQITSLISTTYEKNTRRELFGLALKSNWTHLSRQKIGYLNQILLTDISNSSALLTYVSIFLFTVANIIVYTLLTFNVSPAIAGITMVFGIIIFFIFKPLFYKSRMISQKSSQLFKDVAHYVDEVLIGIKSIKASYLQNQVIKRGFEQFDVMRQLNFNTVLIKNSINSLLQPLGMFLIIVIFAYFYKTSSLNFASLAVIVYAINKVFTNIQISQVQLHQISSFVPYLSAVADYKKQALENQEIDDRGENFDFSEQLEFRNVSFDFNENSRVLTDISFSIKKGEMVGIIGPSGSGKTTIVDLLLRLLLPKEGQILMGGCSIENIKISEWRSKIGYVSQDSFLVNDTVENNIKFYNDKISRSDIERAAKMANIDKFIESLPEKYDTVVGERGVRLSGGQRQRIILSRVLATNPQLLILDEATSALDNESESMIQDAIKSLKGAITVVIIAHRLSTVMIADKLVVIDKGKIIEQGPPDKLMSDKNTYLYRVFNLV